MLRNCAVDFVEICNVYVGKMIIKATKTIFNSDKICRSYSDLNLGALFGTQCTIQTYKNRELQNRRQENITAINTEKQKSVNSKQIIRL